MSSCFNDHTSSQHCTQHTHTHIQTHTTKLLPLLLLLYPDPHPLYLHQIMIRLLGSQGQHYVLRQDLLVLHFSLHKTIEATTRIQWALHATKPHYFLIHTILVKKKLQNKKNIEEERKREREKKKKIIEWQEVRCRLITKTVSWKNYNLHPQHSKFKTMHNFGELKSGS